MLKLVLFIFCISCMHNEKFTAMDGIPVNKLESKVYKVNEKIETHDRIPISNLELMTEYQYRIDKIDIASIDPFYIELYKMKDILIPENFISFINKDHSLLKFKQLLKAL